MSDDKSKIQGEGDYEAAEKYNENSKEFIEKGNVEKNKDNHAKLTTQEKQEARKAEDEAKSHSKK